jgi:hypothetical protein
LGVQWKQEAGSRDGNRELGAGRREYIGGRDKKERERERERERAK